jgi:hypothetical protein
VAKAQDLGDNKHSFRLKSSITRNDRKTAVSAQEFVHIDFSFEYRLRGSRIYVEVKSEASRETFGSDSNNISGIVVAKDYATAMEAYLSLVRNAYNSQIVLSERQTKTEATIALGAYTSKFTPSGKNETMLVGFEFSFSAFSPRASGVWSIKYGIQVEIDYLTCRKNTTLSGNFFGSQSELAAAQNRTDGNALDAFIASLSLGNRVKSNRTGDHDRVLTSDVIPSVSFSESYIDRLSGDAQILECEVQEEMDYSGTRWVNQSIPDGPAVIQDCGIEAGTRVISGSVTATNETAAKEWVKKQNPANESSIFHSFPTGIGGGDAPDQRFFQRPKITTSWDFIPLTDGSARGETANAACVKVSFTFAEVLPDFQYAEP